MGDINTAMTEQYRNDFLKEVEANVEEGQWVKMCMQCGVCSGSCPLGPAWEHPPQEIFMMIRAGRRDEVLKSESMWMCTSCYNCIVRCPRELPITHIMHGLANYAHRLGLAPKMNPTRRFAKMFWKNLTKSGRVNEIELSVGLYFMDGFKTGVARAWAMKDIGLGMLKTRRLNPFGFVTHKGCKDKKGIQKMLKKAQEIEDRRKGFAA
ncbi:4Fe-4S dicluster domain-containing protein [Acidiferrobacter sp.]|jgi:quinone-modifying oxidoreductase subunit QmoC|uniref:4Fe-4S dicluster domain-containing protein n=1 Tax=Acidiferrobacter sp. TaxID=1872107 RepID=UPI0026099D9E|nr:4Fe-4S dicluster domain-containing protein [Acidiferrobacter sp.]